MYLYLGDQVGDQVGDMAPGESLNVLRRNGREMGVAAWIGYVVAHVVLRKAVVARAARAAGGDALASAKTVKIRLSDGTYRSFTESGAGKADMSWFGTVEFYVPVLVQASEVFFLLKLGHRFYDAEPGTGRNEWTRFMTILWAAFGLMPIVDGLLPEDWSNPAPEDQKHSRHELKFRAPLYIWTALEVFLTFHGLKAAAHPKSTLSLREKVGVVGSLALFNVRRVACVLRRGHGERGRVRGGGMTEADPSFPLVAGRVRNQHRARTDAQELGCGKSARQRAAAQRQLHALVPGAPGRTP